MAGAVNGVTLGKGCTTGTDPVAYGVEGLIVLDCIGGESSLISKLFADSSTRTTGALIPGTADHSLLGDRPA